MDWRWAALSGAVKIFFALGPVWVRRSEFNFGSVEWLEAKDVVSVSACRSILATVPVMLALQTYERTEAVCGGRGVAAFVTIVLIALVALAAWLLTRVRHNWVRGVWRPAIVTVLMIGLEAGYANVALTPTATLLCQPAVAPQPVAPASSGPAAAPGR